MKLTDYRKISAAINADVTAALAKHGLKVAKLNARIDERLGIVRMIVESVDTNQRGADGSATTPDREYYKQSCELYRLRPEWLDKAFQYGRKEYVVAGLKRRGNKCVVVRRTEDSKDYVMTPEMVLGLFTYLETTRQVRAS